jgi:RimJ/RimL family protein N-acetyltransferase
MVILTTERLMLRHFKAEDLEPLYDLYRDPEMRRYYPNGTLTREETKAELEWFMNGHPKHPELGLWATIDRHSGKFLGRCGLLHWTMEGKDEIEVAYMIDKKHWREGLATEAATGIVQYALSTLGLKRLICLVIPGNEASAGVARKIGMHLERTFEDEFGLSHVDALSLAQWGPPLAPASLER